MQCSLERVLEKPMKNFDYEVSMKNEIVDALLTAAVHNCNPTTNKKYRRIIFPMQNQFCFNVISAIAKFFYTFFMRNVLNNKCETLKEFILTQGVSSDFY